jgi:hypothetical protein
LPIDSEGGEKVQFQSPFVSRTFRKVAYMTKNQLKLSARKVYIMSFFNDSYMVFNTTKQIAQFSNFIEHYDTKEKKWLIDSLTLVPYTKMILQYSIHGQLKKMIDASELFDFFG